MNADGTNRTRLTSNAWTANAPKLAEVGVLAREDQDGQGNRACVTRVAAPGTGGWPR